MEEERKEIGPAAAEPETAATPASAGQSAPEKPRPEVDFARLIIGMCVIFGGSVLVGRNLGYLPAGFEFDLIRFWPILLVALGLSLLDRRSRVAYVAGLAVTLLLVVLFALLLKGAFAGDYGYVPQLLERGEQFTDLSRHPGMEYR